MDSLSHECTASKHRYDQCFNAWFEGYLKPIVTPHPAELDSEPDVDEEEEESPDFEDSFDDGEDEPLSEEEQLVGSLDASSSSSGLPQQPSHHHHNQHHHHPSWSLRNEDRHPDLWPYSSRSGGLKASSTRISKGSVPIQSLSVPLESADAVSTPEAERVADVDPSVVNDISSKVTKQQTIATIPLTTNSPQEQRTEWAKAKKEEYDRNCGALWTDYRECLQRAIEANHPLSALLNQARLENPIEDAEAYDGGGYGAPGAQP